MRIASEVVGPLWLVGWWSPGSAGTRLLVGAAEIRLPKVSIRSLAVEVRRWCDVHDGTARIDLPLTAAARLEKDRPGQTLVGASPIAPAPGRRVWSESSRGDPSGWTVRPTWTDLARPVCPLYSRCRRRWGSPKLPLPADSSCGPPTRREQEHSMPHRIAESIRWRREGIESPVRWWLTNLWPESSFTLRHLIQSVSGSAGMSAGCALARCLVPVARIDRRGCQVPARYAFHSAGIDHRQCFGVGHIHSPSSGQPLSPPRLSGAGRPSTEGHSRG